MTRAQVKARAAALQIAEKVVRALNSGRPVPSLNALSLPHNAITINPNADAFAADEDESEPMSVAVFHASLSRYAESWVRCNFNLNHWTFRREFEENLNRLTFELSLKAGHPSVVLMWTPDPSRGCSSFERDRADAIKTFYQFITGPYWNRIAPCARDGCPRFILRKDKRDRKFCGSLCRRSQHAIPASKRARAELHEARSRLVQETIDSLGRGKRRDWKLDVIKKANARIEAPRAGVLGKLKPISRRFITLLESRGELNIPQWLLR